MERDALRIGLDVDGVLANFDEAYQKVLCEVSGKVLPEGFEADRWDWEDGAGFTKDDLDKAWRLINNTSFWYDLNPLPRIWEVLVRLGSLNDDVYFITSRPGYRAKQQTEDWLDLYGFFLQHPTVLMSSEKGLCCKALRLTHYVDDRRENVFKCAEQSPQTQTFLLDRPWNQGTIPETVRRILNLDQFLEAIDAARRG